MQHTKGHHALLVFDTFKGHLTNDVLANLAKDNIIACSNPRWLHKQDPASQCMPEQAFQGIHPWSVRRIHGGPSVKHPHCFTDINRSKILVEGVGDESESDLCLRLEEDTTEEKSDGGKTELSCSDSCILIPRMIMN